MKRMLYFTGFRMRLLVFDGKRFDGAYSFEPDEEGYGKFEEYLRSSAKSPMRLLIDVIEEDFRLETVPRVFGKDRKAVISRLVDRYYRSSRYFTYSEIIGREKTGRRDHKVLLGALTNPDILTRWLDILEEAGVPISGIWTQPLVSSDLLALLDARSGPVLLVSQQVNSNLRQTFFRDGKMINSRQSVINLDANNIAKIGEVARPEVERTIMYMRSQELIEPGETLHVHILASDEQFTSIVDNFQDSSVDNFHVHNVRDVESKAGFTDYQSRFSDGIFAWLCLRQARNEGHYSGGHGRERFRYSVISTALYAASISVLVAGLLMAESFISNAVEYDKATDLLVDQEEQYRRLYQEKFEAYEDVFANAGVMNAAVDLARQIDDHGKVTPLDLYVELSRIISERRLSDITIDAINWRSEQIEDVAGKPEPVVSIPRVVVDNDLRHAAVIRGRISVSSDNYSESVDRIEQIIAALTDHERIVKAEAIDMPVEIRSEKKFAAESGIDKDREEQEQGVFSLRVLMRGLSDV